MTNRTVIRFGGVCLAGGALAFVAVFAYLAARFNYPEVLDGRVDTVLPNLLAMGAQGRLVWAIYALLFMVFLLALLFARQPRRAPSHETLVPRQALPR